MTDREEEKEKEEEKPPNEKGGAHKSEGVVYILILHPAGRWLPYDKPRPYTTMPCRFFLPNLRTYMHNCTWDQEITT